MSTLHELQQRLQAGALKSRTLVEESLALIAAPEGEGARAFLTVYAEEARAKADHFDKARAEHRPLPRFAGIPIAIKDLFDVAGEVTRAASHVLDNEAPARADADAVALVKNAGFIVVGKTNMTEFSYSGLGLNENFPAPRSPYDRQRGRIPGGSTSGGAVAVADGFVPAALGTDTGGSCRIPAAFCGIVGFKPSSSRVSKRGVFPLAESLDSVGPLGNSVACCAAIDSLLAGADGESERPLPTKGLRIGVLKGYVDEGLEAPVAMAYSAALTRLARQGAKLIPIKIPEFAELPTISAKGGFSGAEAHALHRSWLKTRRKFYDPWVLARLELGGRQTADDYIDLLHARERLKAIMRAHMQTLDALALPTAPLIPPTIDSLGDLEHSMAINSACLRNTSIANFVDCPSISIPCHAPGDAPVGFMLMGAPLCDRRLLAMARGFEGAVRGGSAPSPASGRGPG